ncbi:MAG: DUF1573 domain-containing protein [Planctomycetes bacterium]|nr:DUF1573 domain-containing protein [Planctomycetota bacterium]
MASNPPSTDPQSPRPETAASAPQRRKLPAAAVFLVCLAGGALAAIGLRALAPGVFESQGSSPQAWTDELGQRELSVPKTRGRLELGEAKYDFGEVVDGSHATHRFEFRNGGSEPVTLLEIVKPCTCIAIDGLGTFDSRGGSTPVSSQREKDLLTLQPGQRGYLDLRTFPSGATTQRETRSSSLQLVTNGLGHERVYLELKATYLYLVGVEVRRAGEESFRASRQREVELGTLGRGERASFWIDIIDLSEGTPENFDVTGEITVDGRPWKDGPPYLALAVEDAQRLGMPRKRLVLDLGAGKPMGRIQHEIAVPTTIHGGLAVKLNVRGLVASDLYLGTLTGQRETLPRIAFGVLQPGEPTTVRRTLRYVGNRAGFALRSAAVKRAPGETEPEVATKLHPAEPGAWTLEVELPRGATSSFLLDLELACEPADALPSHELVLQVQGIVPQRAAANSASRDVEMPRLLLANASTDLGQVVHGAMPEVAFEVSNPGARDLAIRRITPEQGPPLRFVRAEQMDGSRATAPASSGAAGPEPARLAVVPARGTLRLVFALDTTPLSRGSSRIFASAEIESEDSVAPRQRVSTTAMIDYPAGLFGTSDEHPDLVLPLRDIWVPPVGRTGRREHEVQLRPARAWDGSFATELRPSTQVPWPSFLQVSAEERTEADGTRLVALRFVATGEKSPTSYRSRVRIETAIGGGYAFEAEVFGEVVEDIVCVREEALRDRSGPGGELLFAHFLRPLGELSLAPAREGEKLEREERLRYLGGESDFRFDPRPRVHWSSTGEEPPALRWRSSSRSRRSAPTRAWCCASRAARNARRAARSSSFAAAPSASSRAFPSASAPPTPARAEALRPAVKRIR